jgi:hypothetical protein
MSPVVHGVGIRLAISAEVGIVADGALETDTLDVVMLVLAKRAVTVYADVAGREAARCWNGLIESHESMHRMHEFCVLDALRAVVPVGAVETLVADTKDCLIAAITKRSVLDIASWSTQELGKRAESILCNGLEGVCGMMAVLVGLVARDAQVEIIAVYASHELVLGVFSNTGVACTDWLVLFLLGLLFGYMFFDSLGESTRILWICGDWFWGGLRFRRELLRSTVDDLTIADKALDEPMVITRAVNAILDTSLAQIVVSIIADVAMVVFTGHRPIAFIAEHGPRAVSRGLLWFLHAERELAVTRNVGQFCEEAFMIQSSGDPLLCSWLRGSRGFNRLFRVPGALLKRRHGQWLHERLNRWLREWCWRRDADNVGVVQGRL